MGVLPSSRYAAFGASIVRLPDSSGTYNLSVLRTLQPANAQYFLYQWQYGDRPDLVAYRLLGNPLLWWAIFDLNPELINPLNVPAGTLVRIPTAPVMGQGTLTQ